MAKLGEIFGSEIDNVTEAGGNCLMRSFAICVVHRHVGQIKDRWVRHVELWEE